MSFYLIDHIEQGTSEWHDWRRGVIGASDAATIMGENPWTSPRYLLEEKLGLHKVFGGNVATREGHRLEDVARQALTKKFKIKLWPAIIQDARDPFLAASLDAIDATNNHIFEIKCGAKAYELTGSTGTVPSYYIGQLQHMLMVTQLESLTFAVYRQDQRLIAFDVERDEIYIRRLRKKEKQFIKDLSERGHQAQDEFYGHKVN